MDYHTYGINVLWILLYVIIVWLVFEYAKFRKDPKAYYDTMLKLKGKK